MPNNLFTWENQPVLRRNWVRLMSPEGVVRDVWRGYLEAALEASEEPLHIVARSQKQWERFLQAQRLTRDLRDCLNHREPEKPAVNDDWPFKDDKPRCMACGDAVDSESTICDPCTEMVRRDYRTYPETRKKALREQAEWAMRSTLNGESDHEWLSSLGVCWEPKPLVPRVEKRKTAELLLTYDDMAFLYEIGAIEWKLYAGMMSFQNLIHERGTVEEQNRLRSMELGYPW